jgi:ABC-type transport system involved in multi-copper enzyme maturation permease subunit
MKNIFKVFKSELYKFVLNKKIWVFVAALFILIFAVFAIQQNSFYNSRMDYEMRQTLHGNTNPTKYTQEERQQILDGYILVIENANDNLREAIEQENEDDIANYRDTIAKHEFFIETHTIEADYIYYQYIENMDYNYYGTPFLFNSFSSLKYIICFIAILLTTVIVVYEFNSGISRNIISSPLKRLQILIGKMLYVIAITLFVLAVCLIFTYTVALIYGCNSAQTLIVKDGVYHAISIYSIFWREIIGIVAIIPFLTCITAIIGYFTDNHFLSLLLPILIYIGLYFALQAIQDINAYINYFPLVNILNKYFYFDGEFLLLLLYTLILTVILFIGIMFKNRKKEY